MLGRASARHQLVQGWTGELANPEQPGALAPQRTPSGPLAPALPGPASPFLLTGDPTLHGGESQSSAFTRFMLFRLLSYTDLVYKLSFCSIFETLLKSKSPCLGTSPFVIPAPPCAGPQPVTPSERLRVLGEGRLLQIQPTQVSDSGRYLCVATNVAGEDDQDFNVLIQGVWGLAGPGGGMGRGGGGGRHGWG